MFSNVEKTLAQGHNLGIFPEGGSHDRTDLLPLKVPYLTIDSTVEHSTTYTSGGSIIHNFVL